MSPDLSESLTASTIMSTVAAPPGATFFGTKRSSKTCDMVCFTGSGRSESTASACWTIVVPDEVCSRRRR
jgi:hypothetical protein